MVTAATASQARNGTAVGAVSRVATSTATTSPQNSITESACSHETLHGSKPNRAGSWASPECGPEPVTAVPSISTTTATAQVAQPTRSTSLGTSSARGPAGAADRTTR